MALSFEIEWERSESGSPEEKTCFGALGIRYGDIWLTQAEDSFVNVLRKKVHLSTYKMAEWIAWNWWRLRWEPRTRAKDWALAHHMTTIGDGFVWPNITIISDGHRIVLLTKPTASRPAEPLRYVTDLVAVVRATEFEGAVDQFVEQVRGKLRADKIDVTNLDQIWADVSAERSNPQTAMRRRLEAMLGHDPDEAASELLNRLLGEARILGEGAVIEVAADHRLDVNAVSTKGIRDIAASKGFEASPNDAVRLGVASQLPAIGQVPGWRRGAEAAKALREQEHLGAAPISNDRLTRMSGVVSGALTKGKADRVDFSFALDETPQSGRVVFRSKWETGRRFELARLLGDRLAWNEPGKLLPATQTYTYRQKLQRSFAAELLCPFEALDAMLAGDYSPESIEDAAEYFDVSPMTVRTLLVNHGRLDREDLEGDFEVTVAA